MVHEVRLKVASPGATYQCSSRPFAADMRHTHQPLHVEKPVHSDIHSDTPSCLPLQRVNNLTLRDLRRCGPPSCPGPSIIPMAEKALWQ